MEHVQATILAESRERMRLHNAASASLGQIVEVPNTHSDSDDSHVPIQCVDEADFLSDLSAPNFNREVESAAKQKETKAEAKQREQEAKAQARVAKQLAAEKAKAEATRAKEEKKRQREETKKEVQKSHGIDTDVFGEGDEALGKERILLLNRISQYKLLFPNNPHVQRLKVKRGATSEELAEYLNDLDGYVSAGSVDVFLMDAITHTIRGIEMTTARTRFDLTGLSSMLKANSQFVTLCKQLYLKYNTFQAVPPEYQLGFIVMSSAWVCVQANKRHNAGASIGTHAPAETIQAQAQEHTGLDQKVDPAIFD